MANTTNLNLAKPAGTDKALVSVLNSNSDKIDAWAGSTNQAIATESNIVSITDANTATDLTKTYQGSGQNFPDSNTYFIRVLNSNGSAIEQIATRQNWSGSANAMFIRQKSNNGVWNKWQEFALKSVEKSSFTGGDIIKMGNMRCVSFRNLSDAIPTSGVSLGESATVNTVAPCVYYDGSTNTNGLIYIVGNKLYITNNTLNQVSASYIRGQIVYFV